MEISEDEQKALEEAAKNFIAANSDETIAELAVDEDMVKTFLELETYDVKMKDAIEAKADVKLDEKEYQQMSFSLQARRSAEMIFLMMISRQIKRISRNSLTRLKKILLQTSILLEMRFLKI